MIKSQESGFSLIEMLAVVSIFMILAIVSVVSWQASAPVMHLNSAAKSLGGALELCLQRAKTQHSEYFILFNYERGRQYPTTDGAVFHMPINSYTLINDDGWFGPGHGSIRQWHDHTKAGSSRNEFAPQYFPGDAYGTHHRHNNLIEQYEIFKGPVKLGSGITFVSPTNAADKVNRLVFSHQTPQMYWESGTAIYQPIPPSTPSFNPNGRRTDPVQIFLANQKYIFGNNTKDNMTHLKMIRVTDTSIRVVRPFSLL